MNPPPPSTATSGQEVVNRLGDLCRKRGSSVLLVTHDLRLLDDADRIWAIEDGRVQPWQGSH